VFNFEQGDVEEPEPMDEKTEPLREETTRTEVLALIGRGLKELYDAPQPLSEDLAELVRKIERSANE
jgi:hypothetical protein